MPDPEDVIRFSGVFCVQNASMTSLFDRETPFPGNRYFLNPRLLILSSILFLTHVLTVDIDPLAAAIGSLEFAILVFFTVRMNVSHFLLATLILFPTCFDVSYFVTGDESVKVYSIFNFPLLAGYPLLFLAATQAFVVFKKDPHLTWAKKVLYQYPNLRILLLFTLFIEFSGIIMGIIGIFTQEYRLFDWLGVYWVRECISLGIFNIYMLFFIYAIVSDESFASKVRQTLLAILVAMILCSFHFLLTSKTGYYGTEKVLLMPTTVFFNSLAIILLLYSDYKNTFILFFIALLSLVLQVSISSALGGISWLIFLVMPLLFFYTAFLHKRYVLVFLLAAPVAILLIWLLNNSEDLLQSSHAKSKLFQAVSLASIVTQEGEFGDWYERLPLSPKIRVEEFLNSLLELINRPFFLPAGKGFGGTTLDHRKSFGMHVPGAFKEDQYSHGMFISLHLPISLFLLKHGFIGLAGFFIILLNSIFLFARSPWLVFGSTWFALMYGYSFPIAIFGIASLILGYYEADTSSPGDL